MTIRFYCFDQFKIDVEQRLLSRNGEELHLIPKVFDVLLALVCHHGQIVSKDHLMKEVWGETIVEEGNLTEAISKLRKVLGDHARTPKYIQNIPKHGYRFIARVQGVTTDDQEQSDWSHRSKKRPSYSLLWGLAIIFVVAGTGVTYLVQREGQSNPTTSFYAMRFDRLTSTSNAFEVAISPDGNFIAYVTGDSGLQSLRLKHISSGADSQLIPPQETRYRGLTFSPDSSFIFYARREKNESEFVLHQLPVLGGAARKLLSGVDSAITFAPDGNQFAFVRETPTLGESALFIANTDGSQEHKLCAHKSPEFYSVDGPAWSPDGKIIATSLGSFAGTFHYQLMSVQVADGREQPIGAQPWDWAMRTAWLADQSGLVVVARAKAVINNNQIWQIAWPNGKAHRITNDLNDYRGLSLTADSKKLVVLQSEVRSTIWIVTPQKPAHAIRITTDPASQNGRNGLDWTPDGHIIYTSLASGHLNLWAMNADGSQPHRLTSYTSEDDLSPCVSGDGRYIAFVSRASGRPQIWRIDSDGNNPKMLTNGNLDLNPACSPDGQTVIYSSERERTRSIWKIAKAGIDESEPQALSDRLAEFPVISPDGNLIACVYQDHPGAQRKIALIPIAGGAPIKLIELPVFSGLTVRWHPDGNSLNFLDKKDESANVWLQPLNGEPISKLTAFEGERIFRYAWSRDGHKLACARGTVNRDVVMLSGFR